jgi:hypothetical protein
MCRSCRWPPPRKAWRHLITFMSVFTSSGTICVQAVGWGRPVSKRPIPSDFVTLSKTLSEYMTELAGRRNTSKA